MNAWAIEQTIPTLAVPNLEIALAFYNCLGFEVDWQWPEGGAATHAGLIRGGCSIMISVCEPAERSDVYFIVNDVAACHAEIVAAKPWAIAARSVASSKRQDCPPACSLEPPDPPKEQPYGLKDFAVIDPWGHQLSFGQALT